MKNVGVQTYKIDNCAVRELCMGCCRLKRKIAPNESISRSYQNSNESIDEI